MPNPGTTAFSKGQRIIVHGLKSTKHLNGLHGKLGPFDEVTSRWHAELDDGTPALVREANLQLLVDPSAASARQRVRSKPKEAPAALARNGNATGTLAAVDRKIDLQSMASISANREVDAHSLNGFAAGQTVRCLGLKSDVDLNGQTCILREFNSETARWTVVFTQDRQLRCLREANLEKIHAPAPSQKRRIELGDDSLKEASRKLGSPRLTGKQAPTDVPKRRRSGSTGLGEQHDEAEPNEEPGIDELVPLPAKRKSRHTPEEAQGQLQVPAKASASSVDQPRRKGRRNSDVNIPGDSLASKDLSSGSRDLPPAGVASSSRAKSSPANAAFPHGITVPFDIRHAVPGDKLASARVFLSEAPIQALKDMCLYIGLEETGNSRDLVNRLVDHFKKEHPDCAKAASGDKGGGANSKRRKNS